MLREGPGTRLDEVSWPLDADDARVWAAIREMELRRPRYRRARLGLAGAIREAAPAFRRLSEAIAGLDAVEARR